MQNVILKISSKLHLRWAALFSQPLSFSFSVLLLSFTCAFDSDLVLFAAGTLLLAKSSIKV